MTARRTNTLVAVLLCVLALALGSQVAGCNKQGRIDWPAAVSCAPSTSDLVGSVSRVLLADGPDQRSISERAVGELEDLARRETPGVVACLVDELVRGWSRPGAAATPLRLAATARGRDFLDRVAGTNVVRLEVEP